MIDLGCAEVIPEDSDRVLSQASRGTEGYMAPECFKADSRKRFTYTVRSVKMMILSIQNLSSSSGQIPTLSGSLSFISSAK